MSVMRWTRSSNVHGSRTIKSQDLPSERLRARCLLAWAQSSHPDTRRQLVAELGGVLGYPDAGAPVSS
jgi:hypothetical protein